MKMKIRPWYQELGATSLVFVIYALFLEYISDIPPVHSPLHCTLDDRNEIAW